MADNPMGVVVPPGLAYDMQSISQRRALAQALRELGARPSQPNVVASGMGGGMVLPDLGLDKLGANLDANRMFDQADRDQARAVGGYESRLKSAMGGIAKYANPFGEGSMEDVAGAAGEAAAAGVPKEVYEAVLKQRGGMAALRQFAPQMFGGQGPEPAQRPGAPAGPSAPSGGGMGFLPGQGGAQQAPAAGGGVPESLTGTTRTGSPLQTMNEGTLMTLEAMGDSVSPGLGKLAAAELKAREVKVEQGSGLVTRMGKPVGVLKDGIYTDLASGQTMDMQGAAVAQRAGQVAGAQEEEKAKRDVITVKQGGRDRQLTRAEFIRQTQPNAAAPSAPGVPPQADPAGTDAAAVAALRANGGQTVAYTPDGQPATPYRAAPATPAGGGGGLGVGVTPEEQEGRTGLAKGATDVLNKGLEAAQSAANNNIPQIYEAKRLLDTGKVMTGMGANFALQFGRALHAAGLSDGEGVAATQTFVAEAGKRVMGVIKMLGSGSGISDADREYAAKATGGDPKLDEASIRRILDIDERAQRRVIDSHMANVKRGASFFGSPDQRAFFEVQAPPAYQKATAQPAGGRRVVNFADLPP